MDLVARAAAFQEELARRGDEIEAARRLPSDLAKAFAEADFYRLCIPKALGGLETDPTTIAKVFENLATADASAAWCVFISATTASLSVGLPRATAERIYGNAAVITSGVFAPRGKAETADGGYRVSGRWQWGSASDNADFITGGAMVLEGGKPVMDAQMPRTISAFFPRKDVKLHANWHSSGLCGSGSQDFSVDGVFVPHEMAVVRGRPAVTPSALSAFPQFALLALGIGAVALGIARSSIRTLTDLAGAKVPEAHRRTLATRSHTQERVAEGEARLRAARAFFYEAIADASVPAKAGEPIPLALRRDMRLATAHATHTAAAVVDIMYGLGGGSSVYKSSLLQRQFRDVHVATQHMMVGEPVMELCGRHLLGLEIDEAGL